MYIPPQYRPKVVRIYKGVHAVMLQAEEIARFENFAKAHTFARKLEHFLVYTDRASSLELGGFVSGISSFFSAAAAGGNEFIPSVNLTA